MIVEQRHDEFLLGFFLIIKWRSRHQRDLLREGQEGRQRIFFDFREIRTQKLQRLELSYRSIAR